MFARKSILTQGQNSTGEEIAGESGSNQTLNHPADGTLRPAKTRPAIPIGTLRPQNSTRFGFSLDLQILRRNRTEHMTRTSKSADPAAQIHRHSRHTVSA